MTVVNIKSNPKNHSFPLWRFMHPLRFHTSKTATIISAFYTQNNYWHISINQPNKIKPIQLKSNISKRKPQKSDGQKWKKMAAMWTYAKHIPYCTRQQTFQAQSGCKKKKKRNWQDEENSTLVYLILLAAHLSRGCLGFARCHSSSGFPLLPALWDRASWGTLNATCGQVLVL